MYQTTYLHSDAKITKLPLLPASTMLLIDSLT